MKALEPHSQGTVVRIRLQARASRAQIMEEAGGRLRLRVPAPPVEGAANEAAARLLAKRLGVPRSRVLLLRGHRSREKDFLVQGIEPEGAQAALF